LPPSLPSIAVARAALDADAVEAVLAEAVEGWALTPASSSSRSRASSSRRCSSRRSRVREVRDRDAVLVRAPPILAPMLNDTRTTTPLIPPATPTKAPAASLAELGSAA
jgi:hypothetical protein